MNAPATKSEPVIILLVEDEPAHAEIVRRNLADFRIANRPVQLMHVADGQEALDYLFRQGEFQDPGRSPRPHLILLDLRLPKVDGLEVLQTVKSDANLANIPVIVLTTSSAGVDIVKAYGNHANSYLVKPVDCAQFRKLMDAIGFYWLVWNQALDRRGNAGIGPGKSVTEMEAENSPQKKSINQPLKK